jgi:hypothetical protein
MVASCVNKDLDGLLRAWENRMTSNLRQNDDECSSLFEKNRKYLGRDLVRQDIKGNQVVNKKGGKMTLSVRGKDPRTWWWEKERDMR